MPTNQFKNLGILESVGERKKIYSRWQRNKCGCECETKQKVYRIHCLWLMTYEGRARVKQNFIDDNMPTSFPTNAYFLFFFFPFVTFSHIVSLSHWCFLFISDCLLIHGCFRCLHISYLAPSRVRGKTMQLRGRMGSKTGHNTSTISKWMDKFYAVLFTRNDSTLEQIIRRRKRRCSKGVCVCVYLGTPLSKMDSMLDSIHTIITIIIIEIVFISVRLNFARNRWNWI